MRSIPFRNVLALALAALVVALAPSRGFADDVDRADKPLNILILGGTGFIGPHMVEYCKARGHTVTLFNRGKTNADLFPNVDIPIVTVTTVYPGADPGVVEDLIEQRMNKG